MPVTTKTKAKDLKEGDRFIWSNFKLREVVKNESTPFDDETPQRTIIHCDEIGNEESTFSPPDWEFTKLTNNRD